MSTATGGGLSMADGDLRGASIRTPDRRLRVFVSSTLEDLAAERDAAREAIEQLRMAPVMFESGARAHPPQAVYRAYLEQSDIFVGIYWQRYGWVGPGMTISGLEDELRLAAGMPRLLYVKVPAPAKEPGLSRMLDHIRAEGDTAYKKFTDAEELRELVAGDLATLLAERFGAQDHDALRAVLPSPVTGLVDRDADVAEVSRMLTAPGDLLPPPAQQMLARLSVFAAPFTAAAAEAAVGQDGTDAVQDLSTLLDDSMVSPADRSDGRCTATTCTETHGGNSGTRATDLAERHGQFTHRRDAHGTYHHPGRTRLGRSSGRAAPGPQAHRRRRLPGRA
ncbi:MAG TPA: DUF4062 domain-containing protein [Streptosporangiaceae bacterium]